MAQTSADKDSNDSVKTFVDGDYVGSFRMRHPPRDVGGVVALNLYRTSALFKEFKVERCLRFDLSGNCKYPNLFLLFCKPLALI